MESTELSFCSRPYSPFSASSSSGGRSSPYTPRRSPLLRAAIRSRPGFILVLDDFWAPSCLPVPSSLCRRFPPTAIVPSTLTPGAQRRRSPHLPARPCGPAVLSPYRYGDPLPFLFFFRVLGAFPSDLPEEQALASVGRRPTFLFSYAMTLCRRSN